METRLENGTRANVGEMFQGSLFSGDLLSETVAGSADWLTLDEAALDDFEASLRSVFDRFPTADSPNESQTEDDLIWPVLDRLGWTASLRQQNLTPRGREDVPDGLLFADDAAKDRANGLAEEWKRYELGLAVVESKRWLRPLDRRSGGAGEGIAPSTQMLRYLRRVDDLTSGHLRWGILTNGARWRLYFRGRPVRLGTVLRDRPCRTARPSRPQRGPVRAHRARAPSRSEAVHPVFPPGSVPPRRRRLAHVAPAGAGGRPVPPGAGGVQPVRPGLRARVSRSRPRHCRRGAGRAARGGARCRPRRPLPPALHPVCRGPRSAPGARRALRRLRPPRQGARRRGEAQGPRRRLLRDRRPLLVGDRRSVQGGRRRRFVHRSPALRRRALRQGERPSSLPDQAGRSRHGRRHRRPVVRGGAGGSAIHQLPRPERPAARLDLRAPPGARDCARRGRDRRPPECLRTQGLGQLLHPGRARGPDSRRDDRAAGTRPARGFRHGDGKAPQEPAAPSVPG